MEKQKGLIHIYTGAGKGKTTAALGLAVRAAGRGIKVLFLQFLKGQDTGERYLLENVEAIDFLQINHSEKFVFQMTEAEKDDLKAEIKESWQEITENLKDSDYQLIILDELMGVITNGLLTIEEIAAALKEKAAQKEVVLTGRDAPQELIELSNYVTEMKLVKHPFQQNIPARRGIEF